MLNYNPSLLLCGGQILIVKYKDSSVPIEVIYNEQNKNVKL